MNSTLHRDVLTTKIIEHLTLYDILNCIHYLFPYTCWAETYLDQRSTISKKASELVSGWRSSRCNDPRVIFPLNHHFNLPWISGLAGAFKEQRAQDTRVS